MKKLSCILLAVMLITAMFVSCTAEVIDPYDGLAYVTFGGPASKDLSASYEVQSYEKLYWFYTAKKADEFGKTGETGADVKKPVSCDGETIAKGLGGQVGPFSQGLWDFELFAYSSRAGEEESLVYKGSVKDVKLTSSNLTSVPVSVTPQGDLGTIEFRNAFFKWAGASGEGKPTIKITAEGPQTYTLRSDLTVDDPENRTFILKVGDKTNGILSLDQEYQYVSVGYYNCKVMAWVGDDESSPIFEQSFGIRVYGSATTVISGDITEKVDSFVDFEVSQEDLVVFRGASTMEVLSTPSNASDKFTTVNFGSNLDGNTTYSLSVKSTTAEEAAGKFTVSSGSAAVAGIDLTLTNVDNKESITRFNSEITITTYVSTGLSNVKVLYGNDGKNYLKSYNASTGELVFTTNHFSQYYVVSDAVVENTTSGKEYVTLQDAIDYAKDGDEIKLLKDIVLVDTIFIDKGISLNLGVYKISNSIDFNYDNFALIYAKSPSAPVRISGNGGVEALADESENGLYGIHVYNGCHLIIEGGRFVGNTTSINVQKGTLEILGGMFDLATEYNGSRVYMINCFDSAYKDGSANVFVTGGTFKDFNPQDCAAEGAHTNFVAAGYVAEKTSGNEYTIRPITGREVASINGKTYESMDEALNSVGDGECIVLLSDIESLSVSNGKSFTLNLGGRTINNPIGNGITVSGKETELTINGQGFVVSDERCAVQVIDDGNVIVNSGSYVGYFGIAAGSFNNKTNVISNGHVTIKGGELESQEFTIPVWGSSSAVVYDGTFVARDNAVIGTNGNKAITDSGCVYTITINGGTFIGGIQSNGYIACGVYACNNGKVTLNGGEFNITDGVGVVARSGEVAVGKNVKINLTSTGKLTVGKVGDSVITIKANSQIVRDEKSDYPAGSPTITNNSNYKIVGVDGNEIQN